MRWFRLAFLCARCFCPGVHSAFLRHFAFLSVARWKAAKTLSRNVWAAAENQLQRAKRRSGIFSSKGQRGPCGSSGEYLATDVNSVLKLHQARRALHMRPRHICSTSSAQLAPRRILLS
uniref:Putative secreted protein n=1 Tax=Amblyomma tuberculatum TaxID=48802 RepID=A0A6M2E5B6_9ACAR